MVTEMEGVCHAATMGYDLDCGGHAFEPGAGDWSGCAVLEMDRYEWSYLPIEAEASCLRRFKHDCTLVFDVDQYEDRMPLFAVVDDSVYIKVDSYAINETYHDCICHGEEVDGQWEGSGDVNDDACPDCHRCAGDGSLVSPGGVMAFYVEVERALAILGTPDAFVGFARTRGTEPEEEEFVALDYIQEEGHVDVFDIIDSGR